MIKILLGFFLFLFCIAAFFAASLLIALVYIGFGIGIYLNLVDFVSSVSKTFSEPVDSQPVESLPE